MDEYGVDSLNGLLRALGLSEDGLGDRPCHPRLAVAVGMTGETFNRHGDARRKNGTLAKELPQNTA